MAFDPVSWAVGFVLTNSAKELGKQLFSNDLSAKLQKAVKQWAKSLPSDVAVHPDALFPRIKDNSEKIGPALAQLRSVLRDERIPTPHEWTCAFLEHRHDVAANIPRDELQPFFSADEALVEPHVRALSAAITKVCQKDEALHRVESSEKANEMIRLLTQMQADQQTLKKLESHLYTTLGISISTQSDKFEQAQQRKLSGFLHALQDVLESRQPLAHLAVEYGRVIGISPVDATRAWISDVLGVKAGSNSADRRAVAIGIIGARYETKDSNIEFIGSTTPSPAFAAWTDELVQAARTFSPETRIIVASAVRPDGAITTFDLARATQQIVEQGESDVLLVPWALDEDSLIRELIVSLAGRGLATVLPAADTQKRPSKTTPDRVRGIMVVEPMKNWLTASRKKGRSSLLLPEVVPVLRLDGTVELRLGRGLSAALAASFLAEFLARESTLDPHNAVEAIYSNAMARKRFRYVPDLNGALSTVRKQRQTRL
jgi:hypothetical protein